jgi:hypothetical protein
VPDIVSLKMLGIMGAASYAAARLATKAGVVGYRRYALVSVPVTGMPAMPRGFSIRAISPEELQRHVIDVPEEAQADRFGQGLTCLGAFNTKGALVGVNWVGVTDFTESEVHIRFTLPQDAGWDCGLWIAPEYRLGRGFAALWAGTAEWFSARGIHSSLSWIADYNLPSLLSHRRMGASTVGHLTVFRFFRWQYASKSYPKIVKTNSRKPATLTLSIPA